MTKTDTTYYASVLAVIACCVVIWKVNVWHGEVVQMRAEITKCKAQFEEVFPARGRR